MPDFRAVSSTAQHVSMRLPRIRPPAWRPLSLMACGLLRGPPRHPCHAHSHSAFGYFRWRASGKRDTTQAVSDRALVEAPKELHTALRVGRSPLEWILANGKSPSVHPTFKSLLPNVEALNDARTLPGKRRGPGQRGCLGSIRAGGWSRRRGWAGEKSDFFSSQLN